MRLWVRLIATHGTTQTDQSNQHVSPLQTLRHLICTLEENSRTYGDSVWQMCVCVSVRVCFDTATVSLSIALIVMHEIHNHISLNMYSSDTGDQFCAKYIYNACSV